MGAPEGQPVADGSDDRRNEPGKRDLFTGGERDAVRCRRTSFWLADELFAEDAEQIDDGDKGMSAVKDSGSPRSSPRVSLRLPESQVKLGRHSEQARSVSSPAARSPAPAIISPTLPLSAAATLLSPLPHNLSSPPSTNTLPVLPPHTAPQYRSHGISVIIPIAAPLLPSASSPRTRIRRKPVPAFVADDDVDRAGGRAWDGSTPLSYGSPSESSYGFPSLPGSSSSSTATSPSSSDNGRSSMEDKVRRLSIDSETGGGAGLGLRLVPEASVLARRKTLAELKAEKLAMRRRRTVDGLEESKRMVKSGAWDRAGADGLRDTADPAGNESSSYSAPSSVTDFSSCTHSRTSTASSTTSVSDSSASAVSAPPSSSAHRPSRPFALLQQSRKHSLPAHEVIIPPLSAGLCPPCDKDDLFEAWMQIMGGREEELSACDEARPAVLFKPSSSPTTQSQPVILPLPSTVYASLSPSVAAPSVCTTETVTALANSLPPLLYSTSSS
ncbi:hypothetical protein JCM11641_006702 [Rhodosporidiobolus odoratus]